MKPYLLALSFLFLILKKSSPNEGWCEKDAKDDSVQCSKASQKSATLEQNAHKQSKNELPVILYWYEDAYPYGNFKKSHTIQCSSGDCIVSNDRTLQNNPATQVFVFYGTAFLANDLPLPRKSSHLWALFHEESPKNNWIFSHEDAISVFNYTATFGRESHYPLSTQFIVDTNDWVKPKYFVSTQQKNWLKKSQDLAPIVYLQRDCEPPSDRDSYVRELMKYVKIDSYGPCLNNKKMPSHIEGFHKLQEEGFYEFLSKYKFHLSFENAICRDYMTEKLFRPLEIGVVPVYRGSPDAKMFMPNNHSAIFTDDFKTPKDLAEYLTELDSDDNKYNEYLRHHNNGIENDWLLKTIDSRKWRIKNKDRENFVHYMFAGFACELCNSVNERQEELEKHRANASVLPEISIGSQSHMGCPEPMSFSDSNVNKSVCYWEGMHEAKALKKMLLANESDSTKFTSVYLKIKTDKYNSP